MLCVSVMDYVLLALPWFTDDTLKTSPVPPSGSHGLLALLLHRERETQIHFTEVMQKTTSGMPRRIFCEVDIFLDFSDLHSICFT